MNFTSIPRRRHESMSTAWEHARQIVCVVCTVVPRWTELGPTAFVEKFEVASSHCVCYCSCCQWQSSHGINASLVPGLSLSLSPKVSSSCPACGTSCSTRAKAFDHVAYRAARCRNVLFSSPVAWASKGDTVAAEFDKQQQSWFSMGALRSEAFGLLETE